MSIQPFVYGLFDPRDAKHVRYVGMAYVNAARPYAHARAALRPSTKSTHLINWIRKLMTDGIRYDVLILEKMPEEVSLDFVYSIEQMYIVSLRQLGHQLTNLNDGGPGATPGPEARRRMSERMQGNTLSAGRIHLSLELAQQSSSLKRYYAEHPEAREAISKRFLGNTYAAGRVFSDEALKAIGAAHVGKQHALGAIHSDEANKAKSVGLLAYNADPTTADDRARQHAQQGATLSETIAKKRIEDPDGFAEANNARSASVRASWAKRKAEKADLEAAHLRRPVD